MNNTLKTITIATYTLALLGAWHSRAAAGDIGTTVTVTRLVVAKGVSEREPVDAGTEFSITDTERLFAFVELGNPSAEPTQVHVAWIDSATGTLHRSYTLEIGASKRWRTWARAAAPKQPGAWEVVLTDIAGTELARAQFTMNQ